jgi:Eukaryotic-type carbonic anhydrase
VTAVGPGEAPKEWGCDAVWEGGEAKLESCIAVFGIMYRLIEGEEQQEYLTKLVSTEPTVAGEEAPYPDAVFDLQEMMPDDLSYYSYVGSLVRISSQPLHCGAFIMHAELHAYYAPCLLRSMLASHHTTSNKLIKLAYSATD